MYPWGSVVRGLGGHLGGFGWPSPGHVGALGGYLGDLRCYVGRSWCGKPNKLDAYRSMRGLSAGLGCHAEGLRTTGSDLRGYFGVLGGQLVAMWRSRRLSW